MVRILVSHLEYSTNQEVPAMWGQLGFFDHRFFKKKKRKKTCVEVLLNYTEQKKKRNNRPPRIFEFKGKMLMISGLLLYDSNSWDNRVYYAKN